MRASSRWRDLHLHQRSCSVTRHLTAPSNGKPDQTDDPLEDGRAPMRQVLTNADLAAIYDGSVGMVFNDYASGPTAGQNNVLHTAGCQSVARMLRRADPDRAPSIKKIFFDTAAEARTWLLRHRGEERVAWKTCTGCGAGRPVTPGPRQADHPAAIQTLSSRGAGGPFRETEVELLLCAYLRQAGYAVQEKVVVPSGIIDAVAMRGGERIVIEAKGEDRGGYTSAQMNFQMALGQVASRMNDPAARYAIAFPMTADYVKVLRTFRGSLAFEQRGVAFYVVNRSGEVGEIQPRLVRDWIDSLGHP